MNQACPYCAEPLEEADAPRCPSCGESLVEGEGDHTPRSSLLPVLAVLAVVILGGCCVFGGLGFWTVRAPMAMPLPPPGGAASKIPAPPVRPAEPSSATDADVAALPHPPAPTYDDMGVTYAVRYVYTWGGYTVIDIGRARVAIRDQDFPFESSGNVPIHGQHSGSSGSSSMSGSGVTYQEKSQGTLVQVSVGAVSWFVDEGILDLAGNKLDTEGPGATAVVDADGGNVAVFPAGKAGPPAGQ
jgi:hypothetical protein